MPLVNLSNLQQVAAVNISSDPGNPGGPKLAPNCAQITLVWTQESGKLAHNVLGGRYAGAFAGTQAQANGILTALTTGAQWTALAAFLAGQSSLTQVTIRNIAVKDQALIVSNAAGQAGTSVSPSLPNETAAVITLRTALAGRANRGRMYVPGWATNGLGAGNVIAAAAVTALNNWAGTIQAALAAQGYTWVIVQPARVAYTGSTGTAHPERDATSTAVSSVSVKDNHWDSQRRRGLK